MGTLNEAIEAAFAARDGGTMPDDNDIIDGEDGQTGGTFEGEHLAGDNAVPEPPVGSSRFQGPDEPAPFVPTVEGYEEIELEAQRSEIRQQNQRKVQLLEQVGVNLSPAVVGARLETLVDALIGAEGSPERREFDATFEERLAPVLDQIAAQVKIQMAQRDAQEGARLLGAQGQPLRSV